ncbi:hypothetical protein F5148DRAFT_1367301 [Russula earlei]|uniref:Uncharacterized protein n=2 Tax=Russula earlei TaxID=71964 RepID=A0ACC0UDV1_9AGAM|nr:hypothetical protein F5148DRAFT_1356105 [Russula earlei]KAI9509277.1 hypothetical protein F5148DRAFT_1367301 [Russula earlei]
MSFPLDVRLLSLASASITCMYGTFGVPGVGKENGPHGPADPIQTPSLDERRESMSEEMAAPSSENDRRPYHSRIRGELLIRKHRFPWCPYKLQTFGSPLVHPNTMALPLPPLPTGLYIITNVGIGQSAGQPPTNPIVKPIIGTDERPIWRVEHVEENRYHLTIHGFVTRSESHLVFSYLAPEIVGTEWIIQGLEGSDRHTIVIPDGHWPRFWTLRDRNIQVSLAYREGMVPGPNQYWQFTRFVCEE